MKKYIKNWFFEKTEELYHYIFKLLIFLIEIHNIISLFQALPLQTVVVGKANGTNKCRISTLAVLDSEEQVIEFELPTKDKLLTTSDIQWGNYIKGVVAYFKGEFIFFTHLCQVYVIRLGQF